VIAEADVVLVRRGYASKRRWATPPVDRSWDDSVAGFVAARRWSRSSGKSIRWGVAKCDLQRAAVDGLPLRRIDEVRLQTLRSRRLTSALSGRLPPRPARCVRMRSECARRFAFRFISHGPLQRIVRRLRRARNALKPKLTSVTSSAYSQKCIAANTSSAGIEVSRTNKKQTIEMVAAATVPTSRMSAVRAIIVAKTVPIEVSTKIVTIDRSDSKDGVVWHACRPYGRGGGKPFIWANCHNSFPVKHESSARDKPNA